MNRPKIKICGITNKEDAERLVGYGIDALGFIVSQLDTPKKIDVDLAAEIISKLPSKILSVLGVGKYSVDEIIEFCKKTKPDVVQLQRGGSFEDISRIRKALPKIKIWKTVFTNKDPNIDEVLEFEKVSDAILIHSKEEQWEDGLKIAEQLKKPFVLAGSLHIGNVKQAVEIFNPWMVDLISGVETIPGKKDFGKIVEFFAAVRG